MKLLDGKIAIITGASSGIGRAAAVLFAREGAKIVAGARRENELETLVAEIARTGGHAASLAGDIQDEAYAIALVDVANRKFGGLDIAFNNAGILGELGPTASLSIDGWRTTLDINLTGAFITARAQIPALVARGGGTMIFTSSFVGHTAAFPSMAAYAASKAGLIGLSMALAAELAPEKIRVNALLPGGTDTPMGDAFLTTPEARNALEALYPLGRLAAPEEIAQAALFLASDSSSFMTGATLRVDGGISIAR